MRVRIQQIGACALIAASLCACGGDSEQPPAPDLTEMMGEEIVPISEPVAAEDVASAESAVQLPTPVPEFPVEEVTHRLRTTAQALDSIDLEMAEQFLQTGDLGEPIEMLQEVVLLTNELMAMEDLNPAEEKVCRDQLTNALELAESIREDGGLDMQTTEMLEKILVDCDDALQRLEEQE